MTGFFFPQAHSGNDVDFILFVHVAEQHGYDSHDASDRQRHPGESLRRSGQSEGEVQTPQRRRSRNHQW